MSFFRNVHVACHDRTHLSIEIHLTQTNAHGRFRSKWSAEITAVNNTALPQNILHLQLLGTENSAKRNWKTPNNRSNSVLFAVNRWRANKFRPRPSRIPWGVPGYVSTFHDAVGLCLAFVYFSTGKLSWLTLFNDETKVFSLHVGHGRSLHVGGLGLELKASTSCQYSPRSEKARELYSSWSRWYELELIRAPGKVTFAFQIASRLDRIIDQP